MAKNKILDATTALVGVLDGLLPEERTRAIRAALVLLGDANPDLMDGGTGVGGAPAFSAAGRKAGTVSEKVYLDEKNPRDKGEELAVAARYREEHLGATECTKEELGAVIRAARRNFDDRHFKRDLENARIKGLFNRGTAKNAAVLSHYGQGYVDAMPDRKAVKALSKPKGAGRRSPKKKPASKKPAGK
jgi:hypothetical protein